MVSLTSEERSQLRQRESDPHVRGVLAQLDRILSSETFRRVQKADELLAYVIAQTLLGNSERVKESTIALAVYEKTDFDPMVDTTVRVAAKDLRQRLADYYADEGRDDALEILIRVGTYVPEFRDRHVMIEVRLVDCWHPQRDHDDLCPVLTDAIVYWLTRAAWVKACRVSAFRSTPDVGVYTLRSSLEIAPDGLKVNVSVGHLADGRTIFSDSCLGVREDPFRLAERMADATRSAIRDEERHRYAAAIVTRKHSAPRA